MLEKYILIAISGPLSVYMAINKIKTVLISCVISFLCVFLPGCATAPIQEMSDARQSLQAAHDAGADKYASRNLRNAQLTLEQAEKKLEDRAFKEARINAVAAKTEAMDAQEIALAIGTAKDAVSKAAQNGDVSPEIYTLLQQAEQAASQGNKQQAVDLANQARLKVEAP